MRSRIALTRDCRRLFLVAVILAASAALTPTFAVAQSGATPSVAKPRIVRVSLKVKNWINERIDFGKYEPTEYRLAPALADPRSPRTSVTFPPFGVYPGSPYTQDYDTAVYNLCPMRDNPQADGGQLGCAFESSVGLTVPLVAWLPDWHPWFAPKTIDPGLPVLVEASFLNSTRLRMDLGKQSWPVTAMEFRWGFPIRVMVPVRNGPPGGPPGRPFRLRRVGLEYFIGNDSSHIGEEIVLAWQANSWEGTPPPAVDITSWTRELRLTLEGTLQGKMWSAHGVMTGGLYAHRGIGIFNNSDGIFQPSDADVHDISDTEAIPPNTERLWGWMMPVASIEMSIEGPIDLVQRPSDDLPCVANGLCGGSVRLWLTNQHPFVSLDIRQRPVFDFDPAASEPVLRGWSSSLMIGTWDGRDGFRGKGSAMPYVHLQSGVSPYGFHATDSLWWAVQWGIVFTPSLRATKSDGSPL